METILSDHGNNVDITKLSEKKLVKLLKETRKTLTSYNKMLGLPLTEDESDCYSEMCHECFNDIGIIQNYLIKNFNDEHTDYTEY